MRLPDNAKGVSYALCAACGELFTVVAWSARKVSSGTLAPVCGSRTGCNAAGSDPAGSRTPTLTRTRRHHHRTAAPGPWFITVKPARLPGLTGLAQILATHAVDPAAVRFASRWV